MVTSVFSVLAGLVVVISIAMATVFIVRGMRKREATQEVLDRAQWPTSWALACLPAVTSHAKPITVVGLGIVMARAIWRGVRTRKGRGANGTERSDPENKGQKFDAHL